MTLDALAHGARVEVNQPLTPDRMACERRDSPVRSPSPLGRELVTDPTLSYIDAGSGSLLLQAIAGGVAAAGVMAKVYWKRLRRFLHIEKPEDESSTTG
jgi:hypothetical protein